MAGQQFVAVVELRLTVVQDQLLALADDADVEHTTVELEVRGGDSAYLRHAVPVRDVYAGTGTIRTHAGRALCESPGRARPLALGATTEQPGQVRVDQARADQADVRGAGR